MYSELVLLMSMGLAYPVNSQCTMELPCALQGGDSFVKPFEQIAVGGSLHTNIEVRMAEFQLDWLSSTRRLYNGTFPGPTLRFRAGDRVQLDLINTLQQPDYVGGAPNTFHYPNTTNVHTHGLHISSLEPQDNVLINIDPDKTYNYDYQVHPEQPAGTYWYHPHFHGSGYFQNLGGMAGMLIVEDDPQSMSAELDSASCPNNCDKDIPMVFQLFQYSTADDGSYSVAQSDINDNDAFRLNNVMVKNTTQTLENWLEDPVNNIQYVLVNGQLQPNLTIKTGEMSRFRLLNAGGLYALALQITLADGTGSPCSVKEIALDGHYLEKPRDQRLGRSLIVAAGRVDWLVVCEQAGEYQLKSSFSAMDEESMGEHPSYSGILAYLSVTGPASQVASFPSALPPKPAYITDLRDVQPGDVCGKFVIEVTPTDTLNREDYTETIRYRARVGTIQEWQLTNTEYVTSHPIHIHINTFQVISYNKYTGPYGVDDGGSNWKLFSQDGDADQDETCIWQYNGYNESVVIQPPADPLQYLGHEEKQAQGGAGTIGYAQIGDWMDTILVPPLSNITIRFRTDTYTGVVLIHCHLLADAEQGMSMLAEIVADGVSLEADTTSAGANQGACMKNNPVNQLTCSSAINTISFILLLVSLLVGMHRNLLICTQDAD